MNEAQKENDSPAAPKEESTRAQGASIGDELDAAKAIVTALYNLDHTKRERALRYASETLGITRQLGMPAAKPRVADIANTTPVSAPEESASLGTPLDIRQFVDSKSPQSDTQFGAVVAYYYKFQAPEGDRRESIDIVTLQNAARLAGGRKVPNKMTLTHAKNRGYIDAIGDGKFRINTVGENLVTVTLPGAVPRKKSNKGGASSVKKKQ